MKAINRFKKALSLNWYTQGFNAVPLFLNHAAWSGFTMKKTLGFNYSHFLFHYKNGYGEMLYNPRDLERIWKIITNKIKQEPRFLEFSKKNYEKQFTRYHKIFQNIDKKNLSRLNKNKLIQLFKLCAKIMVDSVGSGHMLETVSLGLEKEVKGLLAKQTSDTKKLNDLYIQLTNISRHSFLRREERELKKIGYLNKKQQDIALIKHAQKYFWIQNNYAQSRHLTAGYFKEKLKKLLISKKTLKKRRVLKIQLNTKLKKLIMLTRISIIWQDERKSNILKSIGYLDKVKRIVAKNAGIKAEFLNYLGVKEVRSLKNSKDITKLIPALKIRTHGCLFLQQKPSLEYAINGSAYRALMRQKLQLGTTIKQRQLAGIVANTGKTTGRVIICKGLASLKKVKTGNVIVASMTRPEFMPALKKAAAIITDEGGITCHAAIISRELGIPCIIGTKIATKVLKDGDLVGVDAENGIVKII